MLNVPICHLLVALNVNFEIRKLFQGFADDVNSKGSTFSAVFRIIQFNG